MSKSNLQSLSNSATFTIENLAYSKFISGIKQKADDLVSNSELASRPREWPHVPNLNFKHLLLFHSVENNVIFYSIFLFKMTQHYMLGILVSRTFVFFLFELFVGV